MNEDDIPIFKNFKPLTPEEEERRTASEKQMMERQHQMKVDVIFHECNAPIRHLKSPQHALHKEGAWGSYWVSMSKKLNTGFLVGICGTRGNGKTQLGVELMRLVMRQERSAYYMTAVGFFSRVKDSYRKDSSESELDIMADLRKPRLLVIDEVGKRGDSNWENNLLFELINNRYGDMTDTLLIDNSSKAEFEARIGPSLSSRMQETGGIIEASWESFRK